MSTVSAKQKETGKKDETREIPNAFAKTPQAKDDLFTMGQIETNEMIAITENTGNTFVLDVMANDKGGRGRELWSLGNETDEGDDDSEDLLNQAGSVEVTSTMGARISITPDGKVAYTFTPELQAELQSLAEGEFATDTFTYAIRFGNGALSWATATVKIAGVNDAPVLTGIPAELAEGTEGMFYQIKISDLLAGYTDAEGDSLSVENLTATHGTLAETDEGWLFSPDAGFSGDIELSYDVIDGHGGSTAATQSFRLAPVIMDTAAPIFNSSYPWDDSADFPIDGNIQLDFNEVVKAGSGNIVISNGSDTRTIDVTDTSQVTFNSSKGKVIVNPTDDLIVGTEYSIQMNAGVIEDMAGNDFVGITDPTALNFTTISSDPVLSWSNPWDGSMDFQADGNIELYFNEIVKAGSGDIVISNGADTRTIPVNDASQITFDGSRVIINPTADLISGATYSIQMAAGVIEDVDGNDYAGISDPTALNFTTINPIDPWLAGSNPWDESVHKIDGDIYLYFNESVKAGSGDIVISNGSDTRTISVNDASQVTFDGYGSVIINPASDLILGSSYNIQITTGAIEDIAGNDYAGISDPSTLNFTTIPSDPLLVWSDPSDEAAFKVDNNIHLYFDEMIQAGNGNIVISNGSDTRTISVNDANQVTFDGYGGVIINPASDLIPGSNYNIQIASGAIEDMAGNDYVGISDPTTLNFATISSDPLLVGSNPWDDSMDFQVDSHITLNFDEAVKAGSGDIVISNGSDTRTISITDASQVTFNSSKYGNSITINPIADLIPNTTYNIQMAAGVIEDMTGNDYAGIADPTMLNFTTIPSDPVLAWSNPWDDFTEFQVDGNIELNFNEAVRAGSGDIVISNGSDTRTISVSDANQVTFNSSKNQVIINPTADLISGTTYSIQMASGVIEDLAGHDYAGIADPTTLNFTTIPSDPLLYWSSPWDEAAFKIDGDIQLYFNEAVRAGSGNIVISNGSDTRTISVNDASQVTFDGYGGVIINPTANLILGSDYNIQIASGAIEDMNGHTYAGIADSTTLNFTTISSDPLLYWSNPWDESILKLDSDITLSFDEMVKAGNGDIVISNGSDTRTISINDASQVTFDGYGTVLINPTDDLVLGSSYNIQIASGAIEDMAGNDYAGISDPNTLNFTTVSPDPLLNWSNPWDEATDFWVGNDIKLYFDEVVQAGSGDIMISGGADIRMISIDDVSQVTISGSKITINPTMDLLPNTSYNIQLAEGVIMDMEGNAYAGINDATTLNFMTTDFVTDPFVTTMGVTSSVV